jgi:hypothetical protein
LWAPRWAAYALEWHAVDRHTRIMAPAVREWRSRIGPSQEIVVLGLPYTIGEIADAVSVDEFDAHASSSLRIVHANLDSPAAEIVNMSSNLTLAVVAPSSFGACAKALVIRDIELPEEVVVERVCDPAGNLASLTLDLQRLTSETPGITPILWTGSEGIILGSTRGQ